jgi:hypothetical protein
VTKHFPDVVVQSGAGFFEAVAVDVVVLAVAVVAVVGIVDCCCCVSANFFECSFERSSNVIAIATFSSSIRLRSPVDDLLRIVLVGVGTL